MKFFIAFFLVLQTAVFATNIPGTLTLLNDSPYILTAVVYTWSGEFLGQVSLQPGQQKNFTTNLYNTNLNRPGLPTVSITPYRVMWQCAGGDLYSTCQDGATGSFIRASGCPGLQVCNPKEKPKQPPPTTQEAAPASKAPKK